MQNSPYCRFQVIGKSADQRDIYQMILGREQARRHLIVLANLHAREYMTTQLCLKQIAYYGKNYDKKMDENTTVRDILNQVAIHYFPSCNPDGTVISQYGFSMIRDSKLREELIKTKKDPRTWKANARGVDLNRNWDSNFWHLKREGKPGLSGEYPESEWEVKALLRAIDTIEKKGEICGIISYHSTGSVIYGRCTKDVSKKVGEATKRMYKKAQELTGYELMPEEAAEDTLGCSREYFLYKRRVPFITIEIGEGECPLKAEEFPAIWEKNKNLVLEEAMLFLNDPF